MKVQETLLAVVLLSSTFPDACWITKIVGNQVYLISGEKLHIGRTYNEGSVKNAFK